MFQQSFLLTKAFPEKSTYTLNLPNEPNHFLTFHSSLLHKFIPNNYIAFPSCELSHPGPVITPMGEEEWLIDHIINECVCGHSQQFLVQWCGWGAEEDCWLPGHKLRDTQALNDWLTS
jgi:hypothetical protein